MNIFIHTILFILIHTQLNLIHAPTKQCYHNHDNHHYNINKGIYNVFMLVSRYYNIYYVSIDNYI